jgi:hypothetical protein
MTLLNGDTEGLAAAIRELRTNPEGLDELNNLVARKQELEGVDVSTLSNDEAAEHLNQFLKLKHEIRAHLLQIKAQ